MVVSAHGCLLIITDPRADGSALSDYQRGMLNNVLTFTRGIVDDWEFINIVAANANKPLRQLVQEHKATEVLLMGKRLANVISKVSDLKIGHLRNAMLYGILTEYDGVRWIATPALSDYTLGPEASWEHASLIGHLYRHLEMLRIGHLGWSDPSEPSSYRVVRGADDWDELRGLLESRRVIAQDTETTSLQRIGNTVLTIQFGFDGRTGWVLPVAHPETPLSSRDLQPMLAWLRDYYERGRPAVHVYANATFDLHQLTDLLKIQFYAHKIWDVAAGQMNLEENRMLLPLVGFDKKGIYTLERLCIEAGMDHFERTKLGKADRAQLVTKPLEDVAEYAAVDVCLPIRLMQMQRALAAWRDERMPGHPYARYFKTITEVEGAKLQQFCFHPDTWVATERGPRRISQLVRDEDRPRVWSFNHENGEAELQEITASSSHAPDEEMVEIVYESGKLCVTASHELWCVNRGYVRAKDLRPNDELLLK